MPVALFEFDNTLANTFTTIRNINRFRGEKLSVGTMDEWSMCKLDFNAYILVMIYHLRQKGYTIDIYSRRGSSDPNGELVSSWLHQKEIYYDKLHVVGKDDSLLSCIRGYTYLITTSVNDAKELYKYSMLSSSTIVDTIINKSIKLPHYCNRLYL